MAVIHGRCPFNAQIPDGARLRDALNTFERGMVLLIIEQKAMFQCLEGLDTSVDSYTFVTARYGFEGNDNAKLAYDELNSLLSKINTNNTVAFTADAIQQALARLK